MANFGWNKLARRDYSCPSRTCLTLSLLLSQKKLDLSIVEKVVNIDRDNPAISIKRQCERQFIFKRVKLDMKKIQK
jgi:hypothetical protein